MIAFYANIAMISQLGSRKTNRHALLAAKEQGEKNLKRRKYYDEGYLARD